MAFCFTALECKFPPGTDFCLEWVNGNRVTVEHHDSNHQLSHIINGKIVDNLTMSDDGDVIRFRSG